MTLRFDIGNKAWFASWGTGEEWLTCPDCGGTGRIRVTFHDETQVSISCGNCAPGYDPPTGRVRVYKRSSRAEQVTITGFEVGPEGVRWRLDDSANCYRIASDIDLFSSSDDAEEYARVQCERLDAEERAKVLTKEKDTRSWAWNASYHRKQIKDAERNLAYHTSKLAVAAIKAKETRTAEATP